MNIIYKGKFFSDAFRELGHTVYVLPDNDQRTLPEQVNAINAPIDFVFIELFGGNCSPEGIKEIDAPVALYFMDSPLNEFWMKDAVFLGDHIFTDQISSQEFFGKLGIRNSWLPLFAMNEHFVQREQKIYDIAFVGTMNNERKKRANLINHISRYFKINVAQNLSLAETQKLFAQSQIILNENLFAGLTLRVFQGMAAGSLVFTEDTSTGLKMQFDYYDNIMMFNPDNVIDNLNTLLRNRILCQAIGEKSRHECMEKHTPLKRALQILENMEAGKTLNIRKSKEIREWKEISARFNFIMRFGGNASEIINSLKNIIKSDSIHTGEAFLMLGDLYTYFNKFHEALTCYETVESETAIYEGSIKKALLHLRNNDLKRAEISVLNAISRLPPDKKISNNIYLNDNIRGQLLDKIAQVYFYMGKSFDLGFKKPYQKILPDNALETSLEVLKMAPNPQTLILADTCLSTTKNEGMLLDQHLECLKRGMLSRDAILNTAAIAKSYYNFDAYNNIMNGMA